MHQKTFVKILYLEVLVALAALVFVLAALWKRPLGPVLGLSLATPEQAGPLAGNPTRRVASEVASPAEATPTPSSLLSQIVSFLDPRAGSSKPLCNGPAVMTRLVVGSDERSEDYLYGLADSIRIVRIDFTAPKMMILDVPRDLWVEIPGIADHYGVTHGKLNQAYFFGNPGMGYYDGPGEGPGTARPHPGVEFWLERGPLPSGGFEDF